MDYEIRKEKPKGHFRALISKLMEKYTLSQIVAKADIYFPSRKNITLPPGTVIYKDDDGLFNVTKDNITILQTASEVNALQAESLSIQTFGQYIRDAAKILKALVYTK